MIYSYHERIRHAPLSSHCGTEVNPPQAGAAGRTVAVGGKTDERTGINLIDFAVSALDNLSDTANAGAIRPDQKQPDQMGTAL